MSAPDFYFANNAIFRHIHDRFGIAELVRYWRELGAGYYKGRALSWRGAPMSAVASDWRDYFEHEPQAQVAVTHDNTTVTLDVAVCPAIKHLRDCGRDIVPYFCDHCDHVTAAMAELAGCRFERTGGNGSCRQQIIRLSVAGKEL